MAADAADEPRRELGAPVLRLVVSRELRSPHAALGGRARSSRATSRATRSSSLRSRPPTMSRCCWTSSSRRAFPIPRSGSRSSIPSSRIADCRRASDGPGQPLHAADLPAGEREPDARPARGAQCGLSRRLSTFAPSDYGRRQYVAAGTRRPERQHAEGRNAHLDAQPQPIAHPDRDRERCRKRSPSPRMPARRIRDRFAEGDDPAFAEHDGLRRRPLSEAQFRRDARTTTKRPSSPESITFSSNGTMYESFFGLTGKPFQLNPDPSFFYGSRGHKRAFAYLEYGLYQSEGFIVITGDIGAGKTTIVRSLLEQLDSSKVVAVQLVSTQLEADDMLRAVGTAFGLPVRSVDKAILLASLEAFLCQLAVDKKRALLVVDEAQNLPPGAIEELRMLSNFQLGDQALLQSFLVGQPELRAMMQSPQMQQLRQRVIASYHLGPLDKSRNPGLCRAPAEARGLEGRSTIRARMLRSHPCADRRHPAADQHAVQPAAARDVSRRAARNRDARRGDDRPRDRRGDGHGVHAGPGDSDRWRRWPRRRGPAPHRASIPRSGIAISARSKNASIVSSERSAAPWTCCIALLHPEKEPATKPGAPPRKR